MSSLALPCNDLSSSIKPSVLPQLMSVSAFDNLVNCLLTDFTQYIAANVSPDPDFVRHHRTSVVAGFDALRLQNYEEKLKRFRKISEYKLLAGGQHLSTLQSAEPTSQSDVVAVGAMVSSALNQFFFSVEYSCKLISALGDQGFATQLMASPITNHNDVFSALARLGLQKFLHKFSSLKRTYSYFIRARMLADYSELFFETPQTWHHVSETIYPAVQTLLQSSKSLLFESRSI